MKATPEKNISEIVNGFLPLLLVLALFQQTGITLLLSGMQQANKHIMKKRIAVPVTTEGLSLVKIPRSLEEDPDDTYIRTEAWEFRYCGRMYDIVRQESHADTTWYFCIFDERETRLVAELAKHLEHATERRAATVICGCSPPISGPLYCVLQRPEMPAQLLQGRITAACGTLHALWRGMPEIPPPQV